MIDEESLITNAGILEVAIRDIQQLENDDYALARKDYIGASDTSVLLNVNLYKTKGELILEKKTKRITDKEREVGKKPVVMKGRDLEPFILTRYEMEFAVQLIKPQHMYRFKDQDYMAVNFDGVDIDLVVPVEIKLVSQYGERYYNKEITEDEQRLIEHGYKPGEDESDYIKRIAEAYGIPAYYFTQVQQQIAGLGSEYGYLYAWFDKSWYGKRYWIRRDQVCINAIQREGDKLHGKITN